MYYKISQSTANKWYWYLHQASGHIYHISEGYYQLQTCLDDLAVNGPRYWKELSESK